MTFSKISDSANLKSILAILTLITGISALYYGFKMFTHRTSFVDSHKYVITEAGQASSLDPLNADQTANLPVARMLYLTPLEVSPKDTLESQILETFSYEPETKTIVFGVKKGLLFENGEPITTHDVLLAILRMAASRPNFPVICDIIGLNEWLENPHPLEAIPNGIEVAENTIRIHLKRKSAHPLFRFCLELFSIIPASCIDLKNGSLLCPMPSPSGRYRISKKYESGIYFERRPAFAGHEIPETINFVYEAPKAVLNYSHMPKHVVVAGSESQYTAEEIKLLKSRFNFSQTPKSRFRMLLLNTASPAFTTKKCRQVFAHFFRKFYSEQVPNKTLEGSITPMLVPGYIQLSELQTTNEFSTEDIAECAKAIRKAKYTNGYLEANANAELSKAASNTLILFGITEEKAFVANDSALLLKKFLAGEIAMAFPGSGLWPLDPFGDLKMFFTPNLHKQYFAQHKDKHLQSMLDDLYENPTAAKAEQLNRYLFEDASVNVLEHFSRFYLTSKEIDDPKYTSSITSLSPWQVFSK